MIFLTACAEAIGMAVANGKVYYVYATTESDYMTSHQYDRDWLFKAYPGGMKVLSPEGVKVKRMEETREI